MVRNRERKSDQGPEEGTVTGGARGRTPWATVPAG